MYILTQLSESRFALERWIPAESESVGKASRKQKRPPKIGVCAYCGTQGEITMDHVIPRTLFKVRGNSTIRVPACQPCNLAKSKVEPDLRDFIAISYRSEHHPNHEDLVRATARSTLRNRSQTGRRVKWSRRPISVVENGRIRELFVIPNDPEPMLAAVEYIACGLYHHIFGRRVPDDAELLVRYMGHHAPSGGGSLYEELGLPPSGRFQDREGVLDAQVWSFGPLSDPTVFMALDFLYGVSFIVYIGPGDDSEQVPTVSVFAAN